MRLHQNSTPQTRLRRHHDRLPQAKLSSMRSVPFVISGTCHQEPAWTLADFPAFLRPGTGAGKRRPISGRPCTPRRRPTPIIVDLQLFGNPCNARHPRPASRSSADEWRVLASVANATKRDTSPIGVHALPRASPRFCTLTHRLHPPALRHSTPPTGAISTVARRCGGPTTMKISRGGHRAVG